MTDAIPALPLTPHLSDRELNDLLDGRVPPDDRARLEQHLEACPRCRDVHDELRSMLALARASRHTAVPPEELWSLVSACTVHERAVRRQLVRSARTPIAGVALVVATLSATAGAMAMRDTPAGPVAGSTHVPDPSESAATEGAASAEAVPDRAPPAPAVAEAAPARDDGAVATLANDPDALRARAAAIDVRIRDAVKTAAKLTSDSLAYRQLADLYAERRTVMDALRATRR